MKIRYKIPVAIVFLVGYKCSGQVIAQAIPQDTSRKNMITTSFEEKQKQQKQNSLLNQKLYYPTFDFRLASKKVTPAVVHIESTYPYSEDEKAFHRLFYGDDLEERHSEASGVIVSSDGYIVSNYHVIENANKIDVILQNQQIYNAKVIGSDPKTDLALLKIDENNLPFVEFGNSDEIEVGDWVLAIGNPFDLTSTVTSGIVSAKARNINLINGRRTKAYIQTDAAVNSGNSGGALVDYSGRLIGINSAIESPNGAFAGYSFAIPVNIVKKIIDDILVNGKVQRAYLGATLSDMTGEKAKEFNSKIATGVYIDSIFNGGAAAKADLKLKDIIVAINDRKITSSAQFEEIMEQRRPNEKILLSVIRDGKELPVPIKLSESEGIITKPSINESELLDKMGITVEELSSKEKRKIKINNGLKVNTVTIGKIFDDLNIKPDFIITRVNGKSISTKQELEDEIEATKGIAMIEGVYPHIKGFFFYTFKVS